MNQMDLHLGKYFITKADNIFCTGSVNSLADLTIHFIQLSTLRVLG